MGLRDLIPIGTMALMLLSGCNAQVKGQRPNTEPSQGCIEEGAPCPSHAACCTDWCLWGRCQRREP